MPTYAIWLMPAGEIYSALSTTIAELGKTHGASIFEPHVTLLGDLPGSEQEIIAFTSLFARQLSPYDIYLTTPAYEDQYFRCLYLKVHETSAVMEANVQARRLFNQANDPPYRPHLSLLYGTYPISLKTEIIAALPSFQGIHFSATTLHLIKAESTNPKDWHKIHAFPFSG